MKNLQNLKKEKGITLVALVVTIVVLLILAGVSLNLVLGENGIIAKARDARDATQKDAEDTQEALNSLYDEMEEAINGGSTGGSGGSGGDNTLPSTDGTKPYLPSSDFSMVAGTDLNTGLVIEDNLGNQYVWIEVPNDGTGPDYTGAGVSKKEEYTDTDYTNIENALKTYTNYYRNGTGYSDTYYSDATTGLTSTEYTTLKNTMLKSVYENGGFYIGRYEAGIEGSYRAYGTDYNTEHPIEETVVIKANAYPYNWVRCSQAQTLASNMNSGSYTSSLMFGVQWDLVLKYLETKGVRQSLLSSDSTSWGNYKYAKFDVTNSSASYSSDKGTSYTPVGETTYPKPESSILLTTGANETRNSKMNICDLAGNVNEWTLEYTSYSGFPCAFRGGYGGSNGSSNPASGRSSDFTAISSGIVGFRVALY